MSASHATQCRSDLEQGLAHSFPERSSDLASAWRAGLDLPPVWVRHRQDLLYGEIKESVRKACVSHPEEWVEPTDHDAGWVAGFRALQRAERCATPTSRCLRSAWVPYGALAALDLPAEEMLSHARRGPGIPRNLAQDLLDALDAGRIERADLELNLSRLWARTCMTAFDEPAIPLRARLAHLTADVVCLADILDPVVIRALERFTWYCAMRAVVMSDIEVQLASGRRKFLTLAAGEVLHELSREWTADAWAEAPATAREAVRRMGHLTTRQALR